MISGNYFEDNPDIRNHLDHFIDWDEVLAEYENGFEDAATYQKTGNERLAFAPSSKEEALDFYREILRSYGDLCGNEISQIAADMDREGLHFAGGKVTHPEPMVKLYEKFHEAGLVPMAFRRKVGGTGVPHVIKALASEINYRADSSMTIAFGSVGLASILEMYADPEVVEEWVPKLIDEKYSVTMGLSEPDFGSDLPNVRTKAELKDGRWLLNGTKRYQTMACGINQYPGVTLALARTGGQGSGARGLSFFLVEGKDIQITGLEKKLGLKASATCEVAYEDAPGILIGHEGHGLSKYVIGMLNGARLGVSSQGTGMATAAYYEARKYASERIQFGKPIAEIPAVARMLRRMEREIAAMRCLMVEAALMVDRYHWRALRARDTGASIKGDEHIRKWEKLASTVTPMAKYYVSEMSNSLIYDALQVFGGSGFVEEYDLARLYRDVRITNLYDGTTQIQINAAIGGVISGMSPKGILRQYIDELIEKAPLDEVGQEHLALFEELVELYKGTKTPDKEAYSFEVVETAARLIIGLYLERTALMLGAEAGEGRLAMAREYRVDSLGLAQAARLRLREAFGASAKVPAGV